MAATSRVGRILLAWLVCAGSAAGQEDDWRRCASAEPEAAEAACLRLATGAGERDLLRLADELIAGQQYRRAVLLLAEARRRQPALTDIQPKLELARSYADEQAWVARRSQTGAAAAGDEVGLSLARIRCTRLTGAEALAACDEALRLLPGDGDLLAARGDLLAGLGRIPEATAAYAQALKARPGDPLLRQKQALLAGIRPAVPAAPVVAEGGDLEQRLATLQRLRERRLISEAEFGRRRALLLDGLVGGGRTPGTETAPAAPQPVPAIDFGRYHALVIGIDNYKHLPKLETARNDAKAVAALLRERYEFQVRLLLDASREQIVEALDEYRERLLETDNLLIYYAGHGWLDKEADQGFWLPVDSRAERRSQWLSNDTVRDAAKAMRAKHLLVVADSCFSGTLTRSFVVPPLRDEGYLRRMAGKRARLAMSSGGLEPVADSSGGRHSPFAQTLVNILTDNPGVLDGTTLFGELRRPVAVNAEQTPEFADIRRAGHDGGDFLFVRRR